MLDLFFQVKKVEIGPVSKLKSFGVSMGILLNSFRGDFSIQSLPIPEQDRI